jgi:hypothetical protein
MDETKMDEREAKNSEYFARKSTASPPKILKCN